MEGLIGCEEVIQTLREYHATIVMQQDKGIDPITSGKLELNFLFVGPPGKFFSFSLHPEVMNVLT